MFPVWAEIILAWLALGGILNALGVTKWSKNYIKSIIEKQAEDNKKFLDEQNSRLLKEKIKTKEDIRSINNSYYFR